MNEMTQPITFSTLLDECKRIVVPQIQRDYAQGRDSEMEVRDSFLSALQAALALPVGHASLPLNLDFIYGSTAGEGDNYFLPLDGQQRLTTLFLLHWYLAWRDEQSYEFKIRVSIGQHSRFSYAVRPSSSDFFDELVKFIPSRMPVNLPSVRKLVEDQPWFFINWRLDPTIQSVLTMLDAIHERFRYTTGLYARLIDSAQPVITFQLLRLEQFGLSDDLYIKMNARGKPLTKFETFKAQFEERLKELYGCDQQRSIDGQEYSIPKFFAQRIDTNWTDFFWGYKDSASNTFDEAIMNLLWALSRISLETDSPLFNEYSTQLRNPALGVDYSYLHRHNWLTINFTESLICLLEAWSAGGGKLTAQLPSNRHFNEAMFFHNAIKSPAALTYTELVQFAAFLSYLRKNEGHIVSHEFQEWMRVICNLSKNSNIDSPDDFRRSLAGTQKLLAHARQIVQHIASTKFEPVGFSPLQFHEEVLKAQLILANPGWRDRINNAEEHGYFRGQIEFLFDFSGVCEQSDSSPVSDWSTDLHTAFQGRFDDYLKKAQMMFNGGGLSFAEQPHLWQRALLSVGDYLVPLKNNYSFLTNPAGSWDSWKRFLRGGNVNDSKKRRHLKALWDRLDANIDAAQQLNQLILQSSCLEAWREVMVRCPQVITYCGEKEFRKTESGQFYLLKKKQMNGAHAELFSFALYHALDAKCEMLAPLSLQEYQSVSGTDEEPFVLLCFYYGQRRLKFCIKWVYWQFRIYTDNAELSSFPELVSILSEKLKFHEVEPLLAQFYQREEAEAQLYKLARSLRDIASA